MKKLAPFFLTVLVCSCSAAPPLKREPVKASASAQQELRAAEASAKSGDNKKALARLRRLVQTNPESDVTDNAYFTMGQVHTNTQAYAEALQDYLAILNLPTASPLEVEAGLRATRLQLKMSQPSEAERTLDRIARSKSLTADQAFEAEKLRYESFKGQGKNLRATETLVVLAEKSPQQIERDRFRSLAQDSLSLVTPDELREIADNRKYSFLQAPAKYRYGVWLAEQHQYAKAREYLSDAAALAPGTDVAERAGNLSGQIDQRNKVDARTIGVVLPLSGKQAGIGYKALKGIQLGLGIYGRTPSNFRLAVVDSEGNPDTARRAVERLVQEDGAIALIGGLLSKTVSAEAAKAQEFGVPVIMLAQKAGVTQAGDMVFRNALTSQMQVQYLVDTAMGKMGMKSFAVLYPNDAYGVEFANLFWDEVRAHGGSISGAQPYDPAETDFRGHVQRLVGNYYLEDRADEYRIRSKAWAEKNAKRSARQAAPSIEDLLPPIVDFDAVFIPDSAKAVGQIAPMLAYNNVNNVRLLGTNLWNSPGLVTRGQRFVENAIFADSFLSSDPTYANSEFVQNFKATFDEEPGLTEVQAYDSALILRQLVASGESTRAGLHQRLATLSNFPGAIGRISVNAEREFRRPLTALTVKDAKIKNLDETNARQ